MNNRLGPFGSFSLDGGLGVVDRVPEWTLALPPHLAQSRGGKDTLRHSVNKPESPSGGGGTLCWPSRLPTPEVNHAPRFVMAVLFKSDWQRKCF